MSNDVLREIEFNDGTKVPINTKLTVGQMMKYQNKGLLPEDFVNHMLTGDKKNINLTFEDMLQTTYVSYLNAGGQLNYETFLENCPLDIELLGGIYSQVLLGGRKKKESKFRDEISRATKK